MEQWDARGQAVDRRSFREAMSRLGAAVHVITTAGRAGMAGITASAVCSVTDAPPTVLVCLNRASRMNAVFKANGVFCVNTLHADQEELADMFAGRSGVGMAERFTREPWDTLATGAPAFGSALISADCRITDISEVGSHSVLFGEVLSLRLGEPRPALIYLNRSYRSV